MTTLRRCDRTMERVAPTVLVDALKRQKYHFVGKHSAVKRYRWFHETLTKGRPCYKQKFYGIKTHQCIQMTPATFYCTQQCLFCWRAQNRDLKTTWNEMTLPDWDSPEANCRRKHQSAKTDPDRLWREPRQIDESTKKL